MVGHVIYKYDLNYEGSPDITVDLPKGARILDIQMQREQLCLWAIVNPACESEQRHIHIATTGSPAHFERMSYIRTLLFNGGSIVLHFFEVIT